MEKLISEHLATWTEAQIVTTAGGRGRKSSGEGNRYGIKKLRELILELAVRGKLVAQDPADEPASVLLERIAAEKASLIKAGKIKKQKGLPPIAEDEKPFDVPDGWAWVRLGTVAVIERGGSPRPIKSYLTDDPDGLNWIKIGDTDQGGKYITSTSEKIRKEGLSKTRMVYPGDFLLTNSMSFGRPYITKIEGCIHDGWLRISPPTTIDKEYLYLLLSSPYIFKAFKAAAAGAVVLNLNADKARALVIVLPPLFEQHRIVAKVDELMSLCDRLEQQQITSAATQQALLTTLLDALTNSADHAEFATTWQRIAEHFDLLFTTDQSIDQLKQTILQLAVMGKLVPQNPDDEPASVLLEKIAAEKAQLVKTGKMKKQKKLLEISEAEKPFDLPDGWEWVKFGDMVCIKSELVRPEKYLNFRQVAPDTIEKGSGKLITHRSVKESGVKGPNNRFYKGQVLYSKIRPSLSKAVLAPYDGLCSADMYPMDAMISSEYLLKLILSEVFLEQVRVAENRIKMPKLNMESLTNIIVPLPPAPEQHRIVTKVDELLTLCDTLKTRLQQARTTQVQLADALVAQAVA